MLVMPLQIGRHRSLSPQPHHRNEYQHSPHPPNHPMKPHQHRSTPNRGPEVCGKALGSYVAGVSAPSRHSISGDPGTFRLSNREEGVLESASVQNRQLALKLGEIDRESQRLLKTRQREAAELRKIRKDIHKHSVYENSSSGHSRGSPDISDRLSDVLSHSPINLNLPRVSSRQNSPNQSPARTRKFKVGKKSDASSSARKPIKVVVKDYSHELESMSEPQRTSSDSDLRENTRLLSPGVRKRSMSATSLFPISSTADEFNMIPETTSRSATSSPQHTPTIHIEQCFDDLTLQPKASNMSEGVVGYREPVSLIDDKDLGGRSRRGKAVWDIDSTPTHRAKSPFELRKSQGTCYESATYCKRHHVHHSFSEPILRSAKSESHIPSQVDNSTLDPRFKRLTSVLVPNSNAASSDDVSDCDTGDTLSSASSPSSSYLQLPALKISDGLYDENLARLCRSPDTTEQRSATPERRASPPSNTSQVPTLPDVASPRSSPNTKRSPRVPPRSPARQIGIGKTGGTIGCTFLTPGENEIVSPPLSPAPPNCQSI